MLRVVYFAPIWILFLSFRILMILIGWILVPIAVFLGAYAERVSPITGRTGLQFTWRILWPFCNEEDSIINRDMKNYFESDKLQIIMWSCWRNPVNNLRYVKYLSCKIIPDKVRFVGSLGDSANALTEEQLRLYDKPTAQWFLCWQGVYACIFWQFKLFGVLKRLWIGWKIMPFDVYGVPETSHRINGAGFATQLKTVRV